MWPPPRRHPQTQPARTRTRSPARRARSAHARPAAPPLWCQGLWVGLGSTVGVMLTLHVHPLSSTRRAQCACLPSCATSTVSGFVSSFRVYGKPCTCRPIACCLSCCSHSRARRHKLCARLSGRPDFSMKPCIKQENVQPDSGCLCRHLLQVDNKPDARRGQRRRQAVRKHRVLPRPRHSQHARRDPGGVQARKCALGRRLARRVLLGACCSPCICPRLSGLALSVPAMPRGHGSAVGWPAGSS